MENVLLQSQWVIESPSSPKSSISWKISNVIDTPSYQRLPVDWHDHISLWSVVEKDWYIAVFDSSRSPGVIIRKGEAIGLIGGRYGIPLDTNCRVTQITDLWVEILSPQGVKAFIPFQSLHHIGPALPEVTKGEILPWYPLLRWISHEGTGILSALLQYDESGRLLQTIEVWKKVWLMANTYPLPVDTCYSVISITWDDILLEDVFGNSCRVPLWNISDLHVRYRDPNMPVIDREGQYASSLREKKQKNGVRK